MVPSAADVAKTRYLLAGLVSLIGLWLIVSLSVSLASGLIGKVVEISRPIPTSPMGVQPWSDWLTEWIPWLIGELGIAIALIIFAEPIACLLSPVRRPMKCPACRYSLTALTEPRCPECGLVLTEEFVTKSHGSEPSTMGEPSALLKHSDSQDWAANRDADGQ